ncbi:MAG: pyrroloquinoline quinone precursor peptide PqqA [Bdellovibrionales bacterium]|nr:pyrroloquinoline quinone precursor peptide PqqA [Bdellovibrionales bacterium]
MEWTAPSFEYVSLGSEVTAYTGTDDTRTGDSSDSQ